MQVLLLKTFLCEPFHAICIVVHCECINSLYFHKKKSTKRQFDMKHSCSNKKEPELITLGLDFPSIHALVVLQQLLQIPFTVPKGVFEPLLDLLG